MDLVLPNLPAKELPQAIRSLVPEYLEAGGYRFVLHHKRNALLIQDRPSDYRWIFTSFVQYSILLLLLSRLANAQGTRDFITIQEALQVAGLWTGQVTRESKRNLFKHIHRLQQNLAPWFEIQVLTQRGSVQGYRLISSLPD